jgi:hypothetical protein
MNTDDLPPWRDTRRSFVTPPVPRAAALTVPTNQKNQNFVGKKKEKKKKKKKITKFLDLFFSFFLSFFLLLFHLFGRVISSSSSSSSFLFNDIHPPIACRHRAKAPHLVRATRLSSGV